MFSWAKFSALALLVSGSALATTSPDSIIKPLMQQYQIPGMAVAILHDGKTEFYNYGVASKESGQPINEQTLFEIGSLSKTFTATLASYAAQQNKLKFSDSASQWLPELKGSAFDRVSLLNLATHTSGTPLFVPDEVTNTRQLMHWYKQWQPAAQPGTVRVYSNLGIGMLGMIAAKSLQQPFISAMEKQLLPAMGMTHSYVQVPASQMGRYAQGYNKQDRPVRVTPGPLDAESYGLKSTSADLIRWLAIQLQLQPVAPAWQQAVAATHQGYYHTEAAFTQAMMWEYYPLPVTTQQLVDGNSGARIMKGMKATLISPPQAAPQQAWYNKTGSTNGFSTYAVFIPSQRVALIMLANKWFPNDDRVVAAEKIISNIGKGE
ncbi:class C beta-lactamase [Pantoea dispersa]|uniref:class C beta-lactamase n=1 Tax=Pantoea dispersa TaxID=59814 RepID=UPI002DB6F823|nr:class C beta-lactamase [Pantoea dispersa]MEB5971269.1 beta-lactamase [Pantoea dispersa]